MKRDDVIALLNHKVRILLRNNYQYNGVLKSCSNVTISINDKFGSDVIISLSDIISITKIDGGNC